MPYIVPFFPPNVMYKLRDWLGRSDNPAAISLLEVNPDKIDWCGLSNNPAAMHRFDGWGFTPYGTRNQRKATLPDYPSRHR